jgi:predicted O-methyltransferase YrrM
VSKLQQVYYQACHRYHFGRSIKRLRQLEQALSAPQTRLSVPFLFRGAGFFRRIRPKQSQLEIAGLYGAAIQAAPRTVLEIGTCHGGTLYLWCQAADPGATIISIDLPEGEFGGGYHHARAALYQAFAKPGQHLHLLRSDSHSVSTLEQVRQLAGGKPIDFVFIDGDHTYEGVKQDFELYRSLVADGGMIAFHDILRRPELPRIEVWKLWEELKGSYKDVHEWVDHRSDGRPIGIGMIRWQR